jgi:hypothetical protein
MVMRGCKPNTWKPISGSFSIVFGTNEVELPGQACGCDGTPLAPPGHERQCQTTRAKETVPAISTWIRKKKQQDNLRQSRPKCRANRVKNAFGVRDRPPDRGYPPSERLTQTSRSKTAVNRELRLRYPPASTGAYLSASLRDNRCRQPQGMSFCDYSRPSARLDLGSTRQRLAPGLAARLAPSFHWIKATVTTVARPVAVLPAPALDGSRRA